MTSYRIVKITAIESEIIFWILVKKAEIKLISMKYLNPRLR